jgi:hypothetical protein
MNNDKPNFEEMTRDELAHYMVAHRNTPAGIEARGVFIRQMAKRFEARGIQFYRDTVQTQPNETASTGN